MSKQESFKFLDKAKWLIALSFFAVAVVGNSYYTEVAFLYRVLGVVCLIGLGILFMALTDFGKSSIKLMAESRTELRRVVWPTRVETTQTFLIVFISILVLALLLWGLESLLSWFKHSFRSWSFFAYLYPINNAINFSISDWAWFFSSSSNKP